MEINSENSQVYSGPTTHTNSASHPHLETKFYCFGIVQAYLGHSSHFQPLCSYISLHLSNLFEVNDNRQ